jgi:hypothetical protein
MIATISGNTITFGAKYAISNYAITTDPDLWVLSATRVILVFKSSGIRACILTINGTVVTYGGINVVSTDNGATGNFPAVVAFSNSSFAFVNSGTASVLNTILATIYETATVDYAVTLGPTQALTGQTYSYVAVEPVTLT